MTGGAVAGGKEGDRLLETGCKSGENLRTGLKGVSDDLRFLNKSKRVH